MSWFKKERNYLTSTPKKRRPKKLNPLDITAISRDDQEPRYDSIKMAPFERKKKNFLKRLFSNKRALKSEQMPKVLRAFQPNMHSSETDSETKGLLDYQPIIHPGEPYVIYDPIFTDSFIRDNNFSKPLNMSPIPRRALSLGILPQTRVPKQAILNTRIPVDAIVNDVLNSQLSEDDMFYTARDDISGEYSITLNTEDVSELPDPPSFGESVSFSDLPSFAESVSFPDPRN